MILMILIIFLLINALPAFYFGIKYLNLKKNKSEDKDFERLPDSMMNADKIIIPLSIIIVLIIYFVQK
ncbi:heme/copper-type cytochrome/quinol oxidase subunit 2 [Staphylococcus hominis]